MVTQQDRIREIRERAEKATAYPDCRDQINDDLDWLLSELTASQAAHETDAKIAADMIAELIEQKAALRGLLVRARRQAENGLRSSVLSDWYREGTELLRKIDARAALQKE